MNTSLTPQQSKQLAKQLANLKAEHNRLISDVQFGSIPNWASVAERLGGIQALPPELQDNLKKPVVGVLLKKILEHRLREKEKELTNQLLMAWLVEAYSNRATSLIPYAKEESASDPLSESFRNIRDSLLVLSRRIEVESEGSLHLQGGVTEATIQGPTRKSLKKASDYDLKLRPLPSSSTGNFKLFEFQTRAAGDVWHLVNDLKYRGVLLQAGVGVGKTFIIGRMLRALLDTGWLEGKTFAPWPIIYVTKAPVVEQTRRVLSNVFGINTTTECMVTNYDQLRASLGEMFIKEEWIVQGGEEHLVYKWKPVVHPAVLVLDEVQAVKNEDSQQSRIIQAFFDIGPPFGDNTLVISSSATPFTCVAEAKVVTVSTRMPYLTLGSDTVPIRNDNWPSFANQVAAPADPREHSPQAIENLMKKLAPYVVDVKGVRPQFRALNQTKLIELTPSQRQVYDLAWQRYLDECAKINKDAPGGQFELLAQFTKFRQAAELIRSETLAEEMWTSYKAGKAPVCACNFKATIVKIVKILITKYGLKREDISLIWGGDATIKVEWTDKEAKELMAKIATGYVPKQSEFKKLETYLLWKHSTPEENKVREDHNRMVKELGLGNQTRKHRQAEIDRFQSGKSLFCLFTFKSGGVGLSLHHTDELTKEKCRRKENGYVYVEDIPLIPTRPRETYLAPTYSAIELVQGLGRAPRLTSLSDTTQVILFYKDTIEEHVSRRVSIKLKCLKKVVRQKESWEEAIYEGRNDWNKSQTETKMLAAADELKSKRGAYGATATEEVVEDDEDNNLFDVGTGEDDDED